MIGNEEIIALLFLCSLVLTYFALGNSLTDSQNAQHLHNTGELRQSRAYVVAFFVFGALGMLFAAVIRHNRLGDPSWPMALIALVATVFVLIRSFFFIRLGESGIYFGWRARRYVAYADIVTLERKIIGREPTFIVVLRSGKRKWVGSSLPCEQAFIDSLHTRTGCSLKGCTSASTATGEEKGKYIQSDAQNKSNLKFPISFFILQTSGAVMLLSVLAYLAGGAARKKLISLFPFMANPQWVWVGLVIGLVLVGFAGKVLISSSRRSKVVSHSRLP